MARGLNPLLTSLMRSLLLASVSTTGKGLLFLDFGPAVDMLSLFNLPLSVEAFHEFEDIRDIIRSLDLVDLEMDSWSCSSRSADRYSSQKFYNSCFRNLPHDRALGWIWRSNCVPKLKIFTWLLLNDRLNTFDMMDRRHCNRSNISTCRLCSVGMLQDWNHLFFSCPFSARCWNKIGIQWELTWI